MNKKTPNILLLLPDQHRGDWVPRIGYVKARMPNLQKLMETGTTFSRAITPSPLCAPARACLASGRRYPNCGVRDNSDCYPLNLRTFYSELRDGGYSVGGVGKFDLHKPVHWWGLDGFIDDLRTLGFTHAIDNAGKMDAVASGKMEPKDPYMKALDDRGWREYHVKDMTDRGLKTHPTKLPEDLYCDNWLSENAIDMLNTFSRENPWFLQVNFTGPHAPFDVTSGMQEPWKNVSFPDPIHWQGDEETIQKVQQNYAAMLENIDRNIGRILSWLEEHGEMDNTLIVYSSDHGDMLGDFNKFGKCQPENASIGIPMVISGPGVCRNVVSDALVELQDLAKTFTDYAGLNPESLEESVSLRPVLEGRRKEHRPYSLSALNPHTANLKAKGNQRVWQVVQNKEYKMIMEVDGTARIFDVQADPKEVSPVSRPEIEAELKAHLE